MNKQRIIFPLFSLMIFIGLQGNVQAKCLNSLISFFSISRGFEKTKSLNFLEELTRIEKLTNSIRKKKGNIDPSLNIEVNKKIDILHENIFNNSFAPNEREWRVFFREVETQMIALRQFHKMKNIFLDFPEITQEQFLTKLKELNFSDEFFDYIKAQINSTKGLKKFKARLEEESKKTLVFLGNNYQEYRMVIRDLETLQKSEPCDDICQKQVSLLLDSLGAASEKERLLNPVFLKGETRPSLEEMRKILYKEPLFIMTKAKRERNAEVIGFLKSFIQQPEFIDTLFGYIYKSNILGKQRAVKLFRMIYNSQARTLHFPKINKVIHSNLDAERSMAFLQSLNSTFSKDELLVTFARRADTMSQKKWKSIAEYAKTNDESFYKRMMDAAKKADARGDISSTQKRSLAGRLATLIVIGVPSIGYFYFDALPTTVQEVVYSINSKEEKPGSLKEKKLEEKKNMKESVELSGETDKILDEVSEVLADKEERDPSSLKKEKDDILEDFSFSKLLRKLWCHLSNCDPLSP